MNRPVRPADLVPLAVEEIDAAAALLERPAWERLLAEAERPNPFYGHHVLSAHLVHGVAAGGLRLLRVRRGDRWLALLPLARRTSADRVLGVRRGWSSPYTVEGTPLIAADELSVGAAGLLDGMARGSSTRWLLPHLALDSEVRRALDEAARRRGWPTALVGSFERPVVVPQGPYEAFAQASLGRGRIGSLRRRERRLGAIAPVSHQASTKEADLAEAIDAFLRLEQEGWKGRRGTAMASRSQTTGLARALFTEDGVLVAARADRLLVGAEVAAVSLALVCRGRAYMLKTTFDERYARFSPGLILEDAILRAAHDQPFAACLDSAALEEGVLSELYPGREAVGDWLVSTAASATREGLERWADREAARRRALKNLKGRYWRARDLVQDRWRGL